MARASSTAPARRVLPSPKPCLPPSTRRCPRATAPSVRGPMSAPRVSAAIACARSSTTSSRCRRTRARSSRRARCASSRRATGPRTSSRAGSGSPASTCAPSAPMVASSGLRPSAGASRAISTAVSSRAPSRWTIPRSGRTRRSARPAGRMWSSAASASHGRSTRPRSPSIRPTWSCRTRRSLPR